MKSHSENSDLSELLALLRLEVKNVNIKISALVVSFEQAHTAPDSVSYDPHKKPEESSNDD